MCGGPITASTPALHRARSPLDGKLCPKRESIRSLDTGGNMAMLNEQPRLRLGPQRRGSGTARANRSASCLARARRLLGPFRRTRAALVVGLAFCCMGLVGVAGAATITEFPIPTAISVPHRITTGPDGAPLWCSTWMSQTPDDGYQHPPCGAVGTRSKKGPRQTVRPRDLSALPLPSAIDSGKGLLFYLDRGGVKRF